MATLFLILFRICRFHAGPEVLPASNTLLGVIMLVNGLVSWTAAMILAQLITLPEDAADQFSEADLAAMTNAGLLFTRVVVNLAATAALSWGLLALTGLNARLTQTLTAIFGTDIILTILTLAALVVSSSLPMVIGQMATIGMLFWNIAVLGFIYHRAMDISMGLGVAAGLFVLVFTLAIGAVAVGG